MHRGQIQPVGHITESQCHTLSTTTRVSTRLSTGHKLEVRFKNQDVLSNTSTTALEQLTFFSMDRSCSSLMQLSSSALTSA